MAKDENYFSWDNFDEIAEIDMHLSFLDELFEKYEFLEEDKLLFEKQLEKIKKGQEKNSIRLCVIGEASTGKSAFINAFLRMELLTSGALQGTTKICTYIEYSDEYKLTLEMNEEEARKEKFADLEELSSRLCFYTTSPEEAYHIKKLQVGVPSSFLSEGVQIIDTPGVNADLEWQNSNECDSVIQGADVLLVLTDANKAMPQSLVDFLEMKLPDGCMSCVFLATKCDVIHNNEKDGNQGIDYVLTYIKKRLKSEFNLDDGMVLPYDAIDIIDDFCGEEEIDKALIAISEKSENIIKNHLSRQEFFSRKSRQLRALEETYDVLLEKLEDKSNAYKQQIEELSRYNNTDLVSVIQGKYEQEKEKTSQIMNRKKLEACDQMYSAGLDIVRNTMFELDEMAFCGQSPGNKQVASLCVEKISALMSELFTYYEACKIEFANYLDIIREKISVEFSEKNINILPDLCKNNQVALPFYNEVIWNQKLNDLYNKILKMKKTQLQTDYLKPVLLGYLEDIMKLVAEHIDICMYCYLDDDNGIISWETKRLCEVNSSAYEELVREWRSKAKNEITQKNKEMISLIMDDKTRIKNRRFSASSCRERLENRWKGNKNSDIYD